MQCTKAASSNWRGRTGTRAAPASTEVEFVVTEEEAQRLFALIRQAQVRVFYVSIPARFGVINPDAKDPPELSAEE